MHRAPVFYTWASCCRNANYMPCALQGLAAGLMLCISMIDLLPEAVESIGFVKANIWFYGGVAFFALITAVVPEPNLDHMIRGEPSSDDDDKRFGYHLHDTMVGFMHCNRAVSSFVIQS